MTTTWARTVRRFWAAAEETGALVFVHPTTRGFSGPHDHYLWNTVGNPTGDDVFAAHLVMAGVLERHPGLRSCSPTAAARCRGCAGGCGTA